jgi:AcrR family transcriptional regulator
LLDAARTLFLEQPYDTVSTDAIAREAKVSKATLYVYFPSKDALFAAVVRELCELTADEIWTSASARERGPPWR